MEEQLGDLLRKRTAKLKNIKRYDEKIKETSSQIEIKSATDISNNLANDIKEINEKIEELQIKAKVSDEDFETAQKNSFDIYDESVTILNKLKSYGKVTNETNKTKVRLPPIEIAPFYGDIKDYHSFIQRFKAIDDRMDLSDVEKFTYLISLTKGTAGKLLSGFQLTALNFAQAKILLQEHFGDEQVIINDYITHLYKLSTPAETTTGLKAFVVDVQKTLRQLSTLDFNIEVKEVQRIFTRMILEKIPNNVKNKVKNFDYKVFNELKIDDTLKSITRAAEEIESTDKIKYVEKKKIYQGEKHLHSTAMTTATSVKQTGYRNCTLCGDSHKFWHCTTYDTKDKKFKRAMELKLCGQCLKPGHRKIDCTTMVCSVCTVPGHNAQSCFRTKKEVVHQSERNNENKVLSATIKTGSVALPVTKITLKYGNHHVTLNTLFDQGSQRTFIKQRVIKKLGMKPIKSEVISIDSFATKGKPLRYDIVSVPIKINEELIECDAIVASDTLPERVSISGLKETTERLAKQGYDMANTTITDTINVDFLIGCDHYSKFINNIEKINGTSVLKTTFGLIPFGPLNVNNDVKVIEEKNVSVLTIGENNSQNDIDFLWELDSIGITNDESHPDDMEALKNFEQNIEYRDNKYIARLPWRKDPKMLPSNFGIAKKMLETSLTRLRKEKNKLDVYHRIISEQVKEDFIEVVKDDELYTDNCHYLTHHGVEKDSPTTPLRIVFNCSFKNKGNPVSLNDCLFKGPNLLPEMAQILMRFRLNKIAIISDIKKAFLQVGLHEEDRDFTRFLWVENPYDLHSKIIVYRYRNVLFGSTASQFLLNAVVKKHLASSQDMQTAKDIQRNIYVDNILHTDNNIEDLKRFHVEALKIMKSANLPLVAWTTNDKSMMNTIPEEIRDKRDVISVLGMNWHVDKDTLNIAGTNISTINPTKRKILSGLASQFDPLGIIAPVILPTKLLMRDLHSNGYGWDKMIGEMEHKEWINIVDEYNKIPTIKIPRYVIRKGKVTIHAFSDASKIAYGAVIYAIQENKTQFLIAKSKLAPKKELTIPKLELTGILLSSRLVKYCSATFSDEFEIEAIHLYSDSLVANGWIMSTKELPTYVEKRKIEIKDNVPTAYLHHISGKENPADILSRGTTIDKLKQHSIWWNGPKVMLETIGEDDKLIGKPNGYEYVGKITENNNCYDMINRIITNCGTYTKAIKVMGWIMRIGKKEKPQGKLNATELVIAEKKMIQICQQQEFAKEIEYLLADKKENKSMPDLVKDLNLALEDDMLVVVTRLQGANIDHRQKKPYLIPNANGLNSLIIKQCHEINMHGGINSTLACVMQKYYLPRARQRIKSVLRSCVTCKKETGTHYNYPTSSQLPKYRVNRAKPFEITGVDFAGPMITKNGKVMTKRYVSLFTCATTRAVHLEIANDLSSEAFLQAFERFVARRGYPNTLISDNATNFVKSAKYLSENELKIFKDNVNEKIKCQWIHIPPVSPWWGGLYERLIGIMKSSLRKAIGKSLLRDHELNNILCKIEAVMNDRPLTYVSQENENEILTPSMMMHGHRLTNFPEIFPDKEEILDPTLSTAQSLSRRQTYLSSLLGKFWEQWTTEYLPSLKLSQKDKENYIIPKVDDIVLINNDGRRFTWPMGRIVELNTSKDNKVRIVTLQTKNGIITRPISKVYPLEIQQKNDEVISEKENYSEKDSTTGVKENEVIPSTNRKITPRVASINAKRAIRGQLSQEAEC